MFSLKGLPITRVFEIGIARQNASGSNKAIPIFTVIGDIILGYRVGIKTKHLGVINLFTRSEHGNRFPLRGIGKDCITVSVIIWIGRSIEETLCPAFAHPAEIIATRIDDVITFVQVRVVATNVGRIFVIVVIMVIAIIGDCTGSTIKFELTQSWIYKKVIDPFGWRNLLDQSIRVGLVPIGSANLSTVFIHFEFTLETIKSLTFFGVVGFNPSKILVIECFLAGAIGGNVTVLDDGISQRHQLVGSNEPL